MADQTRVSLTSETAASLIISQFMLGQIGLKGLWFDVTVHYLVQMKYS